ncbi:MAG: hypothetical protein AB6733_04745 [Clostridiaceae bacterium]
MKVVAKPIEMIAYFTKEGEPHPIKFRLTKEDDQNFIIKVDKILFKEKERIAGNDVLVYRCQSVINSMDKVFELKYDLKNCKWVLFKI